MARITLLASSGRNAQNPSISVNTFVGSAKLTGFLADKWDKRIAHVIEVGPGVWEFWCFDPGKAPILAEVIRE